MIVHDHRTERLTMNRFALAVAASAVLSILGAATPAMADVIPPDVGCAGAGDACNNAGAAGNEKGICTSETCSRLNYACDAGADGSHGGPCGSTSYACLVCELPGSGSGSSRGPSGSGSGKASAGSGSGSSHPTTTAKDAGTTTQSGGKSSSCAAAPIGTGVAGGALFLGLGAMAVMGARRRRRP